MKNFHQFTVMSKMMDQYVKYNSDYHVLICCQHAYGLAPNYIERHFRDTHKTISLETRRDIVSYTKTLDLWQPEQVNRSEPTLIPIAVLPIIQGFKCQYQGCQGLRGTNHYSTCGSLSDPKNLCGNFRVRFLSKKFLTVWSAHKNVKMTFQSFYIEAII